MRPQVAGRSRRTPLIKEWRDAMTEVGDHQSLVASLKGSNYYNMFKDEVGQGGGESVEGRQTKPSGSLCTLYPAPGGMGGLPLAAARP